MFAQGDLCVEEEDDDEQESGGNDESHEESVGLLADDGQFDGDTSNDISFDSGEGGHLLAEFIRV